jgi:hypothetical protein
VIKQPLRVKTPIPLWHSPMSASRGCGQLNTRVIVHKVVEPSRSHAIAGDNTIAITRFAATCQHAGLDQVHDAVSDDVAMNA